MTEKPQSDDTTTVPNCPKCGGAMWDNREGKRNPKAPDFKCKDRECDGVIWPKREATTQTQPVAAAAPNKRVDAGRMPLCPLFGGAMWADPLTKRNRPAPDF